MPIIPQLYLSSSEMFLRLRLKVKITATVEIENVAVKKLCETSFDFFGNLL